LCATMLKPHSPNSEPTSAIGRFFAWFNRWFANATSRYQRQVGGLLSRPMRYLAVFAVLVAVTALLFNRMPGSFLPEEDQGAVMAAIQAPPGATTQRTNLAISQVEE